MGAQVGVGRGRQEGCGSAGTRPNGLLVPAGVSSILLLVYVSTLLPGVGYFGDTAKFQFVGYVLGTPHQPGYPTYTMLNWLFTHALPVGSIAWRANLLSAVLSAFAAGVVARVLLRLGVRPLLAVTMGLSLGLLEPIWSQAIVAEVYAYQLLIVGGLLLSLIRWQQTGRDVFLWASFGMVALGLGNHITIVLLVPGVVAFLLLVDAREVFRLRHVLAALAALVLGLSQYLYVVWRSVTGALYLETSITRVSDFFDAIRGRQFWHLIVPQPLIGRAVQVGREVVSETWVLGLPASVGIIAQGASPVNVLLGTWGLAMGVFAVLWSVRDVVYQLAPVFVTLTVWSAIGLERVARTGRVVGRMTMLAAIGIVGALLALNLGAVSLDDAGREAQQVAEALQEVPQGAVVVASDYDTYEYAFYHTVAPSSPVDIDPIYVVVQGDPERIVQYLAGEPVLVVERYGEVPLGRPVFALGESLASKLADAGLGTNPVAGGVWRVQAGPS